MNVAALIVAAGSGSRHGGDIPKQYQALGGVPILRQTILAFLNHPNVAHVQIVIGRGHEALYADAVRGLDLPEPVIGGDTRQESVRNGLESLLECSPTHVLIHDAARPLIDHATIGRVIAALDSTQAAIAATPVVDTLRRGAGGTIDRTGLWQVQTPQGFSYETILRVHRENPQAAVTDDAGLAELSGIPITIVEGAMSNLKITHNGDIDNAAAFLMARMGDIRTATGFDVHRFTEGDHVMLCGVRVQHTEALEGHSDADVALHALTDALLGCLGLGDIGTHFPPSDPQWRGADSARFLSHAVDAVSERGGMIAHLDVTIICERPKVGPHRPAMVARLAEIAGIPADRISVKATTTEGLGFTGRREGIAAQAVATVRLPL